MDVGDWLKELGLARYAAAFAANDVDAALLVTLTADDLKELGVASLGHRKTILAAIEDLTGSADQASPQAYTPKHLATRILASREALAGERKQVTVLFADVKGSLALIESQDPEDARQILDAVIGAMMAAVHRYEGTVNKVLGDGIMALFGAPLALEDHAVRACYAALALQKALAREAHAIRHSHGIEVSVRVGLHSGEVVVRAIGNDLGMDYDAIGQTVHLASRLEQLACPGSVCLSADTVRLAEGFIDVAALGAVRVKGLSQPVETFELVDAGTVNTRLQAALARGLTPLVGRQREIAALDQARQLAEQGRGQLVALVGEPGVGKSRLFYEFSGDCQRRGWLVLAGSLDASVRTSSWAPVVSLLKSYCGITRDDDPGRSADKVRDKVLTFDAALGPVLSALLALLDLAVVEPDWQGLAPPQRRRRMLDGVKALLVRQSQVRPLALVFEDLQWLDGETQALLDSLVESLPATRMLLLVNYRPEYQHGWAGRTSYTQLRVDPLGKDQAGALLTSLLGDAPQLADLKRLLTERGEGNPLFLEESVRSLAETGVLRGDRGAYRPTGQLSEIDVPASVAAIVAARIDRLSATEKAVLQLAAVIGEDVSQALLDAVSDLPTEELHGALAELRTRELLYEARLFPEIAYAFKHGLIRRVAYDGLLNERRRALHAGVASALEARHGVHLNEVVETLAHHFEQGALWSKAAEYCLRAAEKAKQRYTYPLAREFAWRAHQIGERDGTLLAARASALELLGDVHSLMGDLETANRSYEAALRLARDSAGQRRIESKRHRSGMAMRDGARIAFYQHGQGDETLLFVNPVLWGLEIFQPILEHLCQEFAVITVDARGTGRSDPLQRPYLLADHVADVQAVIEQAGTAAITGIGISRGANLLVWLAHRHPQLVRRLILVGPVPDQMGPDCPVPRLDFAEAAAGFLARDDLDGLVRWLYGRVFSEPATEDIRETWIANVSSLPGETIRSFFDPDPDVDIKPLLPDLRVPTLVIHGVEDRQVSFAAGRYIAEHIAGAELYAFAGRGHMPMFTVTQEFCDVLRRFVRATAAET